MMFCLEESENVIIGGSGKGNILSFDVFTGKNLYGYGVMKKGACRNLKFDRSKTRLICAG